MFTNFHLKLRPDESNIMWEDITILSVAADQQ